MSKWDDKDGEEMADLRDAFFRLRERWLELKSIPVPRRTRDEETEMLWISKRLTEIEDARLVRKGYAPSSQG